jgi:HEAT repeat protein
VPFQKSLQVGIEHFGWTYNQDGSARSGFEERSDFFSSVAFWYQQGVNEDLPESPYGAARLPLGNATQIEVEKDLSKVNAEGGSASVQKEVFWSKDLLFLNAKGAGSKLNIGFDVEKDGFYEVLAQVAQAPDYGDYVATLDGKQTNSTMITWGPLDSQTPPVETIHNYQPEIFVGIDHRLGWFKLTKGRHVLSFTCVGKDSASSGFNLGIDGIVLSEIENGEALVKATGAGLPRYETPEAAAPVRASAKGSVYRGQPLSAYVAQLRQSSASSRADAIRAIGAFGNDGSAAAKDLMPFLSDSDPAVRGATAWALGNIHAASATAALARLLKDDQVSVREFAALALRDVGSDAKSAVPEVAAALKDPAITVGMAAALALAEMRTNARPAVDALVARLQTLDQNQLTNDEVQLSRNIVRALGEIGSPDAVPALKKVQHLRVSYLAVEAIAKIEGKPIPTWH